MKSIFHIFFFCCVIVVSHKTIAQSTYYVSASGDDLSSGITESAAWQSLSKVNAMMSSFVSGDKILFKRGDVFFGQLRVTKEGLIIGAYGIGEKPTLSGNENIQTSWVVSNGNIWETTFGANKPNRINRLFKAGSIQPLSRYPNKDVNNGYLNFESKSGLTQITDNQLTGTPNWAGSEIVVRGETYRLIRTRVATHNASTITWLSDPDIINLYDGFGYFFCNDLKAIDQEGEWAYAQSTGKIFLQSSTNPNTSNISYSKTDTVLVISSANNVVIENIKIKDANLLGISVQSSNSTIIRNCEVSESGGGGIYYETVTGGTLEDSKIQNVTLNGINTKSTSSGMLIQRNQLSDIGDEAYLRARTGVGLNIDAGGSQVLNNRFENIGYGAIVSAGQNLIKRNFIDKCLLFGDDLAGIYTNFNINNNEGTIIEENIVLNAIADHKGAPYFNIRAQGIYVDNNSTNVTVRNNTVAFAQGCGLFLNNSRTGNKFLANTSFSCGESEMGINNNNPAQGPIEVSDNILVTNQKDPNHKVIDIRSPSIDYSLIGNFKDNYVVNPYFPQGQMIIDAHRVGSIYRGGRKTPYEWESRIAQVSGTIPSMITYSTTVVADDNIKFYYNDTDNDLVVNIPTGRFVDAKNNAYCGSVTIQPFRSVVLFKIDDSPCVPATLCSSPTTLNTTNISEITVGLSWEAVAGTLNYDVRYRVIGTNTWKTLHNLNQTNANLQNLLKFSNYEWQVRSSCYGLEGGWSASQTFTTLVEAECTPPSNLSTKELLGSSVVLTWDAFRVAGKYDIRYKKTTETSWTDVNGVTETNLFIASLTPSTNYEFQVKSVCSVSSSAWSSSQEFTTQVGGQIYNLTIDNSSRQLIYDFGIKSVLFGTITTAILAGRTADNRCGAGVYSFQLPTPAAGQTITGADFNVRNEVLGPVTVELWGLPYRASGNPELADYYDGDLTRAGANHASATAIDTPWLNGELLPAPANVFPTANGRGNLRSYFNNQYANGATGGQWAFLRINVTEPTTDFRMLFDKEDLDGHVPFVTLIFSPRSSDIPLSVTNLGTTDVSSTSISFSWQDNASNETGFIVERKRPGGYYLPIATLPAGTTTYINTGLSASQQYIYRVLAINSDGAEGYSRELSATTTANPPILQAVRQTDNSILLTWVDTGTPSSGFKVERKNVNGSFTEIAVTNANVLTFSDPNITFGFPYTYRVRRFFEATNFAYSNEVIVSEFSYPDIIIYNALANSNPNNTTGQASYTHTTATNVVLQTPTTFNNTTSGCFVSPATNVIQPATTYNSSLTTFAEFVVRPATGFTLNLTSIDVKLRIASGAAFTGLARIAYSLDGVNYIDNGVNLTPTAVSCSGTAFGTATGYSPIATRTWNFSDFSVPSGSNVRFRVYYFNQPTNTSIGLPLVTLRGVVVQNVVSALIPVSGINIPKGQTVNTTIATLTPVPPTLGSSTITSTAIASNNGITLSNLKINPSGAIIADIATTCSADDNGNFTLSYNNGAQNLSASLNIFTVSQPVTGITLNTPTVSLNINATSQLTATIAPANACIQGVTWSSSNPSVASVDANGLVTAHAGGIAQIQVLTTDGFFKDSVQVVVLPETISITSGNLHNQTTFLGTASTSKSYTLSGSNLIGDIQIQAPAGFEISTNSTTGFASSLSLTQTNGNVVNTTIYVRLTGANLGNYSGDIIHQAGTVASISKVAVSGTVNAALKVKYQNGDVQVNNNMIKPFLAIHNEGLSSVPYSELSLRYWFTAENYTGINTWIDYAQLGNSKVKLKYVILPQARSGSLGYVEYSFDGSAGNLASGSNSGIIQSRFANVDWSPLNELDDYSYSNTGNVLSYSDKITLYRNGSLIWGTEPSTVPSQLTVKAYYENRQNHVNSNTISTFLKLNNEGNTPLLYKDLKVRYWFTKEGASNLNYWLDYAKLGNNNVSVSFTSLNPVKVGANTYLEVGFTPNLGIFYPLSSTGNIQYRISKSDWSNFNQSDDYSFLLTTGMVLNNQITVYYQGQLIYGVEPTVISNLSLSAEVNDVEKLILDVLSNPITDNELAVKFSVPGTLPCNQVLLSLYDLQGREVSRLYEGGKERTKQVISQLNTLSNGPYFLRLVVDNHQLTKKVLISR